MEDEAKYKSKILMSDKQHSEEERKRELETLQNEHLKVQQQQKDLFERRIKEEADRATEFMQQLEEQTIKLNQSSDRWSQEKQFYDMQIQGMIEEIGELSSKLNNCEKQRKELESELEYSRSKNETLESQLKDLRRQNNALLDSSNCVIS